MSIDPNKAYNRLPSLPPNNQDFDDVELLKLSNKAVRALAILDGQTSSTFQNYAHIFNMIEAFTMPEAVASSAVENVVTTVSEALQAKALPEKQLTLEQKETNHYVDALLLGNRHIKDKGFLATNNYVAIQKALRLRDSGIRKLPNYKIANETTGEVYYSPPEGEQRIRSLLKDFEQFFNERDDNDAIDPLIKMALLHYQFEAIHPFPDGNGRTGRILMPLYLVHQGYLKFPVLFLSEYILLHRDEYYRKLRAVTYQDEWKEWVKYILNGVIEQANKTSDTLSKILQLSIRYEKKIPSTIPAQRHSAILDYIFTDVTFSKSMFQTALNISPNTASTYLGAMEKAKLVHVYVHGRKKVFYIPTLMEILSNNQ